MNRSQPISFSSVEEFLDYLPEGELDLVEVLRFCIFQAIPDCREKLAYNVPFYYRHSRICYIWPSTVPWGKVQTNGVTLGFTKGFLLPDPAIYLEKGSRKEVYTKTFTNRGQIDRELIQSYLLDAAIIDDELHRKKKTAKP